VTRRWTTAGWIATLFGAVLFVPECRAQPAARPATIGWLGPGARLPGGTYDQFVERARELGHSEASRFVIEFRPLHASDTGRAAADELVRMKVDLIVAQAPAALQAARAATSSIPIVAFFIGDPVRMGVTRSLARPSANVTGFTWDPGVEGTAKLLQFVRDLVPRSRQVALLWNADNESHPFYVESFESQARTLGLSILSLGVRRADELEGAFEKMTRQGAGAVIIFADPFSVAHRDTLSALLGRFPIPALWGTATWPLQGAVIMAGPNVADQPRRAAEYVDRILKGASVASLPFQQPTKMDLVVDLEVARSLGLAVPPSLVLLADRVVGR
jgi:putative ABC transport system substrate-binding protein